MLNPILFYRQGTAIIYSWKLFYLPILASLMTYLQFVGLPIYLSTWPLPMENITVDSCPLGCSKTTTLSPMLRLFMVLY